MSLIKAHLVPTPWYRQRCSKLIIVCLRGVQRFDVCFLWAGFWRKSDFSLHNFSSLSLSFPKQLFPNFYSDIKNVYTIVVHKIMFNSTYRLLIDEFFFFTQIFLYILPDLYAIIPSLYMKLYSNLRIIYWLIEFFFLLWCFISNTRSVRDYSDRYIYHCTTVYATCTWLIYFSNIHKIITYIIITNRNWYRQYN